MSKVKGSRAERELFHMLWEQGFAVVRSAGSGSTTLPAPDLLASNASRALAIECKSVKGKYKYLYEKEISELIEFSSKFGAEALIGVRFDKIGWFFVPVGKLKRTSKGYYCVNFSLAEKHGFKFEDLLE